MNQTTAVPFHLVLRLLSSYRIIKAHVLMLMFLFDLLFVFILESGDSESADPISLKNKTLNDESVPLPIPGLSSEEKEADMESKEGSEPMLFTEKMVAGKLLQLSSTGIGPPSDQKTHRHKLLIRSLCPHTLVLYFRPSTFRFR